MFKFRRTPKSEELDKKLVFSLRTPRLPGLQQLKFLPKILKPVERWILRASIAVLLIVLAAVLTRFLRLHLEAVPQEGGIYREALVGYPRLINPILAISDADRDLARLIYSSLLVYNREGELVGDAVEQFTLEDGGRTIKFSLKDNVKWHDGANFSAEDVAFTIELIKNQAWRSPLWRAFQGITIEVPDEQTVVAKSEALSASFPYLFTFGILPKHVWENVDPASAQLAVWNIKPVGSGPFKFQSLAKTRDGVLNFYRLSRFQNYHGGVPYLKEIVVRFVPDFESALAALREHTVDGVSFIPERLRDKIPTAGIAVHTFDFPRFTGLFFQDRRSEFLRETAVRKALAAVLDRKTIAALVGGAKPSVGPFLEGQVGFARTIPVKAADKTAAEQFLKEAGWKPEEGGWVKDKKRLAVRLTVLDDPTQLTIADVIKRAWSDLGVGVTLEAVSRVAFEREVLRPRAYEVLLFSLVTGADPDPYPFWHASQLDDPGLNLGSVKSRAIDIALEQARTTLDQKVRLAAYLEFQKYLVEEVPSIILFSNPYVYPVIRRVRGIERKAVNSPAERFMGIAQWFMRSRPGWR